MPKKGTKKVKGHIRQSTMFKMGDIEVKDPFSTQHVGPYYRKKTKKRK